MRKKLKKVADVESSHWSWDMVAILVALFLGFGPYVLLSLFENLHPEALVSQKDNMTARIPASEQ